MDSLATAPHLLVTLPSGRLGPYARSLVRAAPPHPASTSSSSTSPPPASPTSTAQLDQLQQALSLAVDLKLVALAAESSWVPFRNPRKTLLDDWVRRLLDAFAASPSPSATAAAADDSDAACRVAVLGGLYQGLKAAKVDRTLVRDVEIEAVVAVEVGMEAVGSARRKGKALEGDGRPPPILHAAAALFPLLPTSSVRALNTRNLLQLAIDWVGHATSAEDLQALSSIVVASLRALATDALHPDHLRAAVRTLAERLAQLSTDGAQPALFFDLVAPVSAVLSEILVSAPLRPADVQRVSRELLLALWRWMPEVDAPGGFEAQFDVGTTWWTLVDVLMSEAWTVDERSALVLELLAGTKAADQVSRDEASLSKINAALLVAEQVIGGTPLRALLPVLKDAVVPTCNSFLDETAHVEVFESAHSVILAILSTPLDASTKGSIPAAVRAFNKNLVHSYLATLLRNVERQQLTAEQLQHAFLLLVRRAADLSPTDVKTILDALRARAGPERSVAPGQLQAHLELFAAVLPAVPVGLLPSYLASLEHLVRAGTAARSTGRADVLALVWDGVSKGLGDEGKLIGVEWWLRLRDRLEREGQRGGHAGAVQAKL